MQQVQLVVDAPRCGKRHGNIWQSGSYLIVWPCLGDSRTLYAFFSFFLHRLRRMERITNKHPLLSSHYEPQKKRGERGERGMRGWGSRGTRRWQKTEPGYFPFITKVLTRQNCRLMRWDRANTNECQPPPNLFCLQTGTICDCMLIIILFHLHPFDYLLHVLYWKVDRLNR